MASNDLTQHLYRRRQGAAPRETRPPAVASARVRRAFDSFSWFVAALLATTAVLQVVLLTWFEW